MEQSIKLLLAGDFAPTQQFQGSFNEDLLNNLSLLSLHDYAVVNLEGPLTNNHQPQQKMGPVLSINPKWASILKASGFNVVSLANNHVLDMG
jgi:poly-gamma-glutamate capsule biosynthesis protein CapA/YwtB (metallophosphatase superfamily)